ncbi:calcium permease family membrane transporter [Nannizzia gypsea CBS 118893]|uniref:Calcium permease family membrane transporter n=1 Tax=Arthroderma gypseum (strain ATCC MYA-4604 / CBS 118893) TaxID=535722 RepID=E4V623_ARTGP|nr:calcium permease family membrane transporter [Nannizzia gypsea CBS 118893]EFR05548.1 calcium permease family membrane transporter [Nannizzia gypsea CBS 118893]
MASHAADDHDDTGNSPEQSSSMASSPRQFAPITRTESERAEELVRSRNGYTYGSIGASGSSYGESSTYDPSRSPLIESMSSERTPKKPAILRRVSSKPHRGQEFSVDDDVDEVEDKSLRQPALSGRSTARQHPSLRRRSVLPSTLLTRVDSEDEHQDVPTASGSQAGEDEENENDDLGEMVDGGDGVDDDDASDAESFTLKDRQQAINETHPFGIRIWKPALYKKLRSVEKTAEGDIHSAPGQRVSPWLFLANILWTVVFGWWLALAALIGAVACFVIGFSPDSSAYGRVFWGLSGYLLYPFGAMVRLKPDENYAEEDEGEGRSISEYEQWQSGDIERGGLFFGPVSNTRSLVGRRRNSMDSASERDSLLGRTGRHHSDDSDISKTKRRLFGRGEWTIGRVMFYIFFYLLVGPLLLSVSLVCWILVFWIPMGRVTVILFHHLRRHPLALSFHSDSTYTRLQSGPSSSILLCTYRAAGLKYWKYTVDGTNIFLINLLAVVIFVIFDFHVLRKIFPTDNFITHPGLIFVLALIAVTPLAYFIGQAVASISAQSSMGLGAAINAFFSTLVEVYLYCIALSQGKAQLVEGSIIGSIFAGILFLPGVSMCFGAIIRKTQRFNVKSAGVTSTMLLFAVIAAFGPTLFYQIYGRHELNCHSCNHIKPSGGRDCRRCYFSQVPAVDDDFFMKAVQPYSYFAAVLLFLSYIIGLWFTLRTHAAIIWSTDADEKKPHSDAHRPASHSHFDHAHSSTSLKGSIRDSQLYARILGQSLKQVGLVPRSEQSTAGINQSEGTTVHVVPPKDKHKYQSPYNMKIPSLTAEENDQLVRQVTEVAATAATVAARDAAGTRHVAGTPGSKTPVGTTGTPIIGHPEEAGVFTEPHAEAHGHDAPNWGKTKSFVILLGATLLYAVIAEILVNTVDVVLQSYDIDEKFLGITLFSLVPNTTEFLNAISFAMNGNIALSMEIGSAYALQVCLLQIPALVLFSAVHTSIFNPSDLLEHSFNLIFPQWDMITVILCVFLLSYVYGEGKSNYFKGSILLLTYIFVVMGFYLSSLSTMGARQVQSIPLSVARNDDGSFQVRG